MLYNRNVPIAKMEQISRLTLKAVFRPIISADRPQNRAPVSIPTYAAMVNPFW
jgi:hypothetical protein